MKQILFHATNPGPTDNRSKQREVDAAAEMAMLLGVDVSRCTGPRGSRGSQTAGLGSMPFG